MGGGHTASTSLSQYCQDQADGRSLWLGEDFDFGNIEKYNNVKANTVKALYLWGINFVV